MAVAAISQLRRNVGFMFRETGQALDRLGMSVMADYAYKEPREFSLSLMMACPRAAGAAARACGEGGPPGPSERGWAGAWVSARRGARLREPCSQPRQLPQAALPFARSHRIGHNLCRRHFAAVSRHRNVMGVYDTHPVVGENAFVAPNASVIGDVTLGSGSSVWYGAILRGALRHLARRLCTEQARAIRVPISRRSCGCRLRSPRPDAARCVQAIPTVFLLARAQQCRIARSCMWGRRGRRQSDGQLSSAAG